jgi:elongation factor Ts
VVVKLSADKGEVFQKEEVKALAFNLALHIAAFNPMALDRGKIDPAFLKEQEDIFRKQMEQDEKLKGKPANVIDNILKGKVNKYLSDICLLEQGYVKEEKFTVAQVLADTGKQQGAILSIADYVYFKVGQ